ncbi:hypothetical protein PInf_018632 [Phytophthora infestans]|nr:hypothetical protein PInf_018632 [Phytophthora infestans]
MSDADKAQWNASLAELPTSKNVFKQARAKGVDPVQTKEFFVDLYDLHYSDERDYETNKQAILAKWDAMPRDSAALALARHIKTMWQYHKTLKINCANPRATPLEMMRSMDRARLAFSRLQ